ncbi:putative bifunctional diguanylate cyclase/phosphodiesterase [Propionivibrio sp.]|uniref:putative bifunctional diguanylate cyclase/phosphodiesterase n=1 Tax=Propionivibrio sp. TaxID=2212460 RepID=UPI003BF18565
MKIRSSGQQAIAMPNKIGQTSVKATSERTKESAIDAIHPADGASGSGHELRQRAEAIFREKATPLSESNESLSPEHIRLTLHELRVHQIELEMQNEELHRVQKELEASQARYFDLYDLAPVGYCTVNESGLILQANLTAATLLGLTQDELVNQPFTGFIFNEDQDIYYLLSNQLVATGEPQSRELRMAKPYASPFWAQLEAIAAQDKDGAAVLRIVLSDISGRKQAEEQLHMAASVFTHAREGIMITTADGMIVDVNDAFSRITGYSRDEVLGQNPRLLSSGRHDKEFYGALWRGLIEKGHWYGEIWNRRKSGEVYPEMKTISAVYDAQGNTKQYVALFSDITELKAHERQLEHLAHYDALTMLPNRVLLADRMHQAMAQSLRRKQPLAVAYLDLDGFKAINDQHGHDAGDQLLITVANRMKESLREGDTLTRMGGDEFVAVLLDLADIESSVTTLSRLLAAAAQPVHVGDLVLQVSASLGVTFYPQGEEVEADLLLRQADQAMYQAKLAGKNRYHVFNPEQDSGLRGQESVERIRRALVAREFVLYYQPMVNMRTGTVVGAEALIRWQHPESGLLPPSVFLPVIEDHPLAVEIGEWVIDTALTQMALWQANGLDIPISVNIGTRQLQQTAFVEQLRETLAAHPGIMPGRLELEMLETSSLEDLAGASRVIEACREFGVMFALDDFGTGYSSLTYLKRLPVTLLKIDQSFVRDMLGDPDDLAILEGLLGLATAFRRQVIVEGVETGEQGEMLLHLGCELAQGYGIARPMPAADLPGWASNWRPDPSWINRPLVSRDD